MMRASGTLAGFVGFVCSALAAGCAPTPGAEIRSNMQAVAAERTPEKLVETARAMAMLGDSIRSEQYLLAALASGTDDATAMRAMPLLLAMYVRDKQYRVAIDCAENALRKHPDDDRLRFLLAALYEGVGRDARAIEEFGRVVDARPDDAEAHYALAVLLRDESRNVEGADAHFREYLRLDPRGRHADEARDSLTTVTP
jgi:Flp pilus assembly protein TadD